MGFIKLLQGMPQMKDWCNDSIAKVENNLKEVESRKWYKDVEDFWKKLQRTTILDLKQMVWKYFGDLQ